MYQFALATSKWKAHENIKSLMENEGLEFSLKHYKKLVVKKNTIIPEVFEEKKEKKLFPLWEDRHLQVPLRLSNTQWGKKPKPPGDIINALEANGRYMYVQYSVGIVIFLAD